MIGTSVDRYKIVEELGHGGMSVVYRGVDTTLDRDVAVKVLHDHLAKKAESRRRFHREAKAIARLRHPNILSIYDYSAEDADRSYIVMEYVKGWNLREFLAEHGTPPPEIAALIGMKIAEALSNAHDHGIIHRDLKPENVMVSSTGELKLTDFGIAHVIDAETMTQTGSLLGSPAHMAPEIIEGERVDRRADVFSLGTVLYWLASGQLPFEGANAPQVLKRVLQGDYVDPETVDPCIGHELSHVIRKCMSHDADGRYEKVRDVRSELQNIAEAGGLDDLDLELRKYLTQPEAYSTEFNDSIVAVLEKRARTAQNAKELPTAMALFNRILAYEPDNAEVRKALDGLGRRVAIPRAVGILFAVLAVVGVTMALLADQEKQPLGATTDVVRTDSEDQGNSTADRIAQQLQDLADIQAITREVGTEQAQLVLTSAQTRATTVAFASKAIQIPVRPKILSVVAPEPAKEPDMGADAEPTFKYKFTIWPAAAQLVIDGKSYSAFQAANGIELAQGSHNLTATSRACKPYKGSIVVSGPQAERRDVVLEWEDGIVKINSEVDAVVYQGDSQNITKRIPARGAAEFIYKLGNARQNPRKNVSFRVAPVSDMTQMQTRTVALAPGAVQSINLSFR